MNGKEDKSALCSVRDGGAFRERYERIVGARQHYFGAEARLQQGRETQRDIQHHIFLHHAVGPNGARVMAAVTAASMTMRLILEAQCPGE